MAGGNVDVNGLHTRHQKWCTTGWQLLFGGDPETNREIPILPEVVPEGTGTRAP